MTNRLPRPTANVIWLAADDWIMAQPRNLLDKFRADGNLVACWHSVFTTQYSGVLDDPESDLHDVYKSLQNSLDAEKFRVSFEYPGEVDAPVVNPLAEMLMWWKRDSEPRLAEALGHVDVSPAVLARVAFLEDVISFPEGLPYFRAGVRDAATARRFLSEGVDVSLVTDLLGNTP